MGSGFVPSGIYDTRVALLAAVLAETDAYADFVGATVAAEGVAGMYFHGIDRRELIDNEENFPARMVIWQVSDDFERYSTQAGGATFRTRGGIEMIVESNTPEAYLRNTPAAKNWIWGVVQGMLAEMELLFGQVDADTGIQRPEIRSHSLVAGPYRESEGAVDETGASYDYVGVAVKFELRN